MFITSDGIKLHDLIKLLEVEHQIVSQEVKGSKVDSVLNKNQNQTLDNVVAKENNMVSDKDRLFVGFEISNPPSLSKLEVERGATYKVTDTYIKAIRTGITSLSAAYKPSVTALAVSKDHNERLYKANISGNRAVDQNIPPGTVVDTKIVSPVINEFYLNAHSAFQGTAKTPKYSLLADDSKIPLDVIEGMTHALCFLHEIVTSTVSVPAPLIVADRCAKRGHNVYIANSYVSPCFWWCMFFQLSIIFAETRGNAAVNSIEEANEKLVNHGELEKVRYNA
ncbi:piwi domain protein [Cooperia oncophora]